MQPTTVGKGIWRGAKKAEELAEAGAGDPTVQERLCKLKLVEALRQREASWSEIQELVGISRATHHRWRKRLRVEAPRRQNPTWGRWPIGYALRKEGYRVSERTVGRILAYLERHGWIESVVAYLAQTGQGKVPRRTRHPYAQRRPKGYEAKQPGDLIQLDTLTVTLEPGEMVKHFSAIDLSTRLALAEVHTRATANLAVGFLSQLLAKAKAPFPIRAIQVDGGSEFMAEFEEACQHLGIALFVLPPRSPRLNGHVERMQRTFREEFYTRPLPSRIPELQAELNAYLDHYNRRRPHQALNGLAPLEFLAKIQRESVPQESQMY